MAFTSKVLQRQTGKDDQFSTHALSSQSIDYVTPGKTISGSGPASHYVALSAGTKTVAFLMDLYAQLHVYSPPGDLAEADFQFGPSDGNSIAMGTRQVWTYTLKPGFRLASCGG